MFASSHTLKYLLCFYRWGVRNDVDFIAASFIRKASDVTDIRDNLIALRKEIFPSLSNEQLDEYHPIAQIVSKIESTEG